MKLVNKQIAQGFILKVMTGTDAQETFFVSIELEAQGKYSLEM